MWEFGCSQENNHIVKVLCQSWLYSQRKKSCFDHVILSIKYYSKSRDGKNQGKTISFGIFVGGGFILFCFVLFCFVCGTLFAQSMWKCEYLCKGLMWFLTHISIGASVHLFKPPLFPTLSSLEIDPNHCQFPWGLKS